MCSPQGSVVDPESAYDQHCTFGTVRIAKTIPVEIGTVDPPQLAFFRGGPSRIARPRYSLVCNHWFTSCASFGVSL